MLSAPDQLRPSETMLDWLVLLQTDGKNGEPNSDRYR